MTESALPIRCAVVGLLLCVLPWSGCRAEAGRHAWTARVSLGGGDPPQLNDCLERVLQSEFGEVRRPADQLRSPGSYGYSYYFRSPVPNERESGHWIVGTIVREKALKLEFSQDWTGPALAVARSQLLSEELSSVVQQFMGTCAPLLATGIVTCESFPSGDPCPHLSSKRRLPR